MGEMLGLGRATDLLGEPYAEYEAYAQERTDEAEQRAHFRPFRHTEELP
jgi:hypothetical protein